MIGPPKVGLTFHIWSSLLASSKPRAPQLVAVVLACRSGEAQLAKKPPLNVLPPSRGIRLMRTPPVSVSAELAATLMLYSSMLPSVKTIADESGRVQAEVDMPSRSMR